MNTIRQLCDRCIVLDKGKIVFDGDVEKAVEIYTNTKKLSDCNVDLKTIKRSNQFLNDVVMMDQLCVDAETSVFKTGSVINGVLYIVSKKNFNNLRLEVPVRSTNGISVARFTSAPCISLTKEHRNRIEFTIDISKLAPGRYSLNPIIRQINEWGGQGNLDGIVEAFCFEIVPSQNFNNGTEWNPYYSGYYVPPTIIIH